MPKQKVEKWEEIENEVFEILMEERDAKWHAKYILRLIKVLLSQQKEEFRRELGELKIPIISGNCINTSKDLKWREGRNYLAEEINSKIEKIIERL